MNWHFEEGIEAVLSTFKQDRIQPPAETAVDRLQNAKNEWQYVHNHFSLAHFHDAITAATDEHISRVQADVGLIFRVIAERAKGKPELERLREFRVLFAYGFGMLFSPINLIVRHQGWGGLIDQYLSSCEVLLFHNIEEELGPINKAGLAGVQAIDNYVVPQNLLCKMIKMV